MDVSLNETDNETKQIEEILNYFKEYEKNKVREEIFQEYSNILAKEQEIMRKDQEFMTSVQKRLQECCKMGRLSKEVQKMDEKVRETQNSLREISKKIQDLKKEQNTTQKNIQADYFQKQAEMISLFESELQHLTEKLQNNRILFQGKRQELQDKIDVERATKDMQYENIKNEKQKQLINSHQFLAKLQNEQRELKLDLNNLKEEQRKRTRYASATCTSMNFDAPYLQKSSNVQQRLYGFRTTGITKNSYLQPPIVSIPGYTIGKNNFQADDFDSFENLGPNHLLQPIPLSNNMGKQQMVSHNTMVLYNNVSNTAPDNQGTPLTHMVSSNDALSKNHGVNKLASEPILNLVQSNPLIEPRTTMSYKEELTTVSDGIKINSSDDLEFGKTNSGPPTRPLSAGTSFCNVPKLYALPTEETRFFFNK